MPSTIYQADDDIYLSWGWSKFEFFLQNKRFPSKHYDAMLCLLWSIKLDKNNTLARTSIRRYLKVCLKVQTFSNLLNF